MNFTFWKSFQGGKYFWKNIHLLTTLRQIIHETKDFGIDFVIHNALKKNKTDFFSFHPLSKNEGTAMHRFLRESLE